MEYNIAIENISIGDFTFQCRTCGLSNPGQLIIFLHGYPETSYMWEGIMPILAHKGYRCLAPDQRGYSAGARPLMVEDYSITCLAADVVAFADYLGAARFHIVGHDWGSNVAWGVAALHQERLITTSNLATFYPAEFEEIYLNNPEQRKRIQYIFRFLKPEAPDVMFADNMAGIRRSWRFLPQSHKDEYAKVFCDKETIAAALKWYAAKYRWFVDPSLDPPQEKYGDLHIPVLSIRGTEDPAQIAEGYAGMQKYMKGFFTCMQLATGHWMMSTMPQFCVPAIIRHIECFSDQPLK